MKEIVPHDDIKSIIQFICACIILIAGLVLMFLGFYAVPIGEISASVLSAIGECFTFAGALWGIERTYNYKTRKLEKIVYEKNKEE